MDDTVQPQTWVPSACTLPTAQQPLRVAELNDLLTDAVEAVERSDDRHARLHLRRDPAVAAHAADLLLRETDCCAFFHFDLRFGSSTLVLDIEVPAEHSDVLDGLLARSGSAPGR